ncbi:protein rapunzel-like [Polymixia lowei]
MSENTEHQSEIRQGLVTVLDCMATIFSAAAVVNPIFGLVGSLTRVVLSHVDDEDIRTLKREFGSINQALDGLSKQCSDMLAQIEADTVRDQYRSVEANLRNQFRNYMEMVEARPGDHTNKKADFLQSYEDDLLEQNLHTLHDGVMGKSKIFGRPMLEVYLKHSRCDRRTMERLCTRVMYLFCTGLIALMGYSAIIGDNMGGLSQEWTEKMEKVQEKMEEALRRCK